MMTSLPRRSSGSRTLPLLPCMAFAIKAGTVSPIFNRRISFCCANTMLTGTKMHARKAAIFFIGLVYKKDEMVKHEAERIVYTGFFGFSANFVCRRENADRKS